MKTIINITIVSLLALILYLAFSGAGKSEEKTDEGLIVNEYRDIQGKIDSAKEAVKLIEERSI